jgi:hypothetical protein
MSKAMFGIATALALAMSPAWAGDEKSDEKAASDTVASRESKSESVSVSKSATGSVVEAGRDSGTMKESTEVRASYDERWLREREGYRDGGY